MNDPRRTDDVRQPAGEPPRESLPRKSSSPLLWILLLIALIAVGWYFYSQRGPVNAPEAPPTPERVLADFEAVSPFAVNQDDQSTVDAPALDPKGGLAVFDEMGQDIVGPKAMGSDEMIPAELNPLLKK